MLHNYLKIALRNFRKQLNFTLINIMGLSLGIGCCLLIMLWLQDELSFDRFHPQANQIFRITNRVKNSFVIISPGLLGQKLKEEIPGIVDATDTEMFTKDIELKHNNEILVERELLYVQPSFLKIFNFPLQQGVDSLALAKPYTIVLSDAMAKKYFPGKNPMGERLEMADGTVLEVTGVLAPIPKNSSLHFQFLSSEATKTKLTQIKYDAWEMGLGFTYVQTIPGYTAEQVEADIEKVIKSNNAPSAIWEFSVMALPDIHLHADTRFDGRTGVQGKIEYIYIFGSVGIFILLIACINFINMATARSMERVKEVGVRKAIGAMRRQLVTQFMSESFLMVTISLVLGYAIAFLLLPQLNELTGKTMDLNIWSNPFFLTCMFVLIPIVALLAGLYPALIVSAFQPVKVLKGGFFQPGQGNTYLRKTLMVVQFAASAMLMISTMVMWKQLDFVRKTNLGFNKEQVVSINNSRNVDMDFQYIKNKFLQLPEVEGVTSAPMTGFSSMWFESADSVNQLEQDLTLYGFLVDEDFLDVLDVPLGAGRPFDKNSTSDQKNSVILNKKAVETLNLTNPIGAMVRTFTPGDTAWLEKEVIGVLADQVNFQGLKSEARPIVMQVSEKKMATILIKLNGKDIPAAMAKVQQTWQEINPDAPFDYSFLDDSYDNLYREDIQIGKAFIHFAGIAIFIAIIGLIGLSSYTLKKRTKEVSIRKVFGASVSSILFLLSQDYFKLIVIAVIISVPVSNYFMQEWLTSFAHKIDIQWWWFAIPGILILLIAGFAISTQTIKTARTNPATALKDE